MFENIHTMPLTRFTTARKHGFRSKPLHKRKKKGFRNGRAVVGYLKQKSSFIVAALSLCAFLAGNIMGETGIHAFWASVIGGVSDDLIRYDGVVPPIQYVPDYTRWSAYGGDSTVHTYKEVPQDLLIPLPSYDPSVQSKGYADQPAGDVYSVGNMGSYATGAEGGGDHVGVDIRVPIGTPVRSIANGVVEQVRDDPYGYGKFIVIRHPHMPDPDHAGTETVLHSIYAHLSDQSVAAGEIVAKGQRIGLSGQTGFATGPHLHFQVDRDEAPWHPYWPFSTKEASDAGLTFTQAIDAGLFQDRGFQYTEHPLLLVQRNASPVVIAKKPEPKPAAEKKTVAQLRDERREKRMAARGITTVAVAPVATSQPQPQAPASSAASAVVSTQTVASTEAPARPSPAKVCAEITNLDIQHGKSFSGREWMKATVTLLDAGGQPVPATCLTKDIALRTAYGESEFKPTTLTAADFTGSTAAFEFLPLGRRTVVLLAQPYGVLGRPIEYRAE